MNIWHTPCRSKSVSYC